MEIWFFLVFLVISRVIFFPLPLHGDIGFFGNWGHFKGENFHHDLILHNGGFRSFALYWYFLFKRIFWFLDVRFHSRLGLLFAVLLSVPGWILFLKWNEFSNGQIHTFVLCLAILTGGFSSGSVYIYTIELLQISFLPWILLVLHLPVPFFLKGGLALFLSLFFKLNLAFDVFFYAIYLSFHQSVQVELFLSVILCAIFYSAYLYALGIFHFSLHGFLAFFKSRNDNWYAWKRLAPGFFFPMILEYFPILLLVGISLFYPLDSSQLWIHGFLLAEIFGLFLQRGFFHYHYICLFPGLALSASLGIEVFISQWPLLIPLSLFYLGLRYEYRKKQFWPKLVEHQGIYNRIVHDFRYSNLLSIVKEAKIVWFAGWRFQFHLSYNARPFSIFLQTVKFMMVFTREEEKSFMPEFREEFMKRLRIMSPDLLILEETELIHLPSLQKLGFDIDFLGNFRGRLSFFRMSPSASKVSDKKEEDEILDELFVRYPGSFQREFAIKMTPQVLLQVKNRQLFIVDKNEESLFLCEWIQKQGFVCQIISVEEYLQKTEGFFILMTLPRANFLYLQTHQRITEEFRIFKYT